LDPDARKVLPEPTEGDMEGWKRYNSQGADYICPDKKDYSKWPYDELCNDKVNECVSSKSYHVNDPTTGDRKLVSERGSLFKERADNMCEKYYSDKGRCISNPDDVPSEDWADFLSFTENSNDPTPVLTDVFVNCELADNTTGSDNCPFPKNTVDITSPGTSMYSERKPILLWQTIWDKIAGPTPRRLDKESKQSWENKERYDIVDQNYMPDK
jgi:hypothetical protein